MVTTRARDALEHARTLSAPVRHPGSTASTMLDEPPRMHLGNLSRLQDGVAVHLEVTEGLVEWRRQVEEWQRIVTILGAALLASQAVVALLVIVCLWALS